MTAIDVKPPALPTLEFPKFRLQIVGPLLEGSPQKGSQKFTISSKPALYQPHTSLLKEPCISIKGTLYNPLEGPPTYRNRREARLCQAAGLQRRAGGGGLRRPERGWRPRFGGRPCLSTTCYIVGYSMVWYSRVEQSIVE